MLQEKNLRKKSHTWIAATWEADIGRSTSKADEDNEIPIQKKKPH
jgi:hypothetical protein